jgi:hypothetical protein
MHDVKQSNMQPVHLSSDKISQPLAQGHCTVGGCCMLEGQQWRYLRCMVWQNERGCMKAFGC